MQGLCHTINNFCKRVNVHLKGIFLGGSLWCSGKVLVMQWEGPSCTVKDPCPSVEETLSRSGRVLVMQ